MTSKSDEMDAYRKELERAIEVRKARLKTRKQRLKAELGARLTPSGVMSQFPLTTIAIAAGVGWLLGRALTSPRQRDFAGSDAPPRRAAQRRSPIAQTLKDVAVQFLAEFAFSKAREILFSQLNHISNRRRQSDLTKASSPSAKKS